MLTNTVWNLAGLGVPILAAIVAMPLLIIRLGDARFGILALGWMVTGYFALFDFGVGRATTRQMAALRNINLFREHAAVFWNSLYVHAALALFAGVAFAVAVPGLVDNAFSIPLVLRDEATSAFYWLAFSVPALVMASALRGPLEAEQRFDLVNAVKLPSSALNYLAPLITLYFTRRIDAVIAVIVLSRWLATLAYALLCWRAVRLQSSQRIAIQEVMVRLIKDGGWLTVSSIVVPVIMALDRSLISRLVSLESVTYYVVPYEVVTKLWILSASLLGAAYPMMSACRGDALQRICDQSLRWLLMIATPATLVVIVFAHDLLYLWVGQQIAEQGASVMQWLALGVWINVLAQVPQTALQATGRAKIVGIIQLLELPLYASLVWCLISQLGITGAAVAWSVKASVEWVVLNFAFQRVESQSRRLTSTSVAQLFLHAATLVGSWLIAGITPFAAKSVLALLLVGVLGLWQWRNLFTAAEREMILAGVTNWARRNS